MSRLNWINPKDYTFEHMLLLDRFQIRMMLAFPWRITAGIWALP